MFKSIDISLGKLHSPSLSLNLQKRPRHISNTKVFLAGDESGLPESNSAHNATFARGTALISTGDLVKTLSLKGIASFGGVGGRVTALTSGSESTRQRTFEGRNG